jgi:hypothetical protein
MNNWGNKSRWALRALALGLVLLTPVTAAAVDVYAEGAYTATNLVLYVYADIGTGPILSAGVAVTFDPDELQVTGASKGDLWYMGDGTNNYPYMDPESDNAAGTVVIICGKLDEAHPDAGVSGDRVPLGIIEFSRSTSTTPVANPEDFFGVTLSLGRGGKFANFVTVGALELDESDVAFTNVIIRQRGDANGDGYINGADPSTLRYYMENGGVDHCWMDCNSDGSINGADRSCVKYIMTH